MSVATQLDAAIRAVAPIIGVSIGRIKDKSTWRIDFAPEATQAQRTQAANIVAAFDVAAAEATEAAEAAALEALEADNRLDASAHAQATSATINTFINNLFPLATVGQRAFYKFLLRFLITRMRRER